PGSSSRLFRSLAYLILLSNLSRGASVYRNASPAVGFVGSKTCAGCHKSIYDSYLQTPMGRSMSLPNDTQQLARVNRPVTIRNSRSNRIFQVYRDGRPALFQSEFELDSQGKELFRAAHQLQYVIGAGLNGQAYVVNRGGYLFQAPLS